MAGRSLLAREEPPPIQDPKKYPDELRERAIAPWLYHRLPRPNARATPYIAPGRASALT